LIGVIEILYIESEQKKLAKQRSKFVSDFYFGEEKSRELNQKYTEQLEFIFLKL
jgi:hypothetical protein